MRFRKLFRPIYVMVLLPCVGHAQARIQACPRPPIGGVIAQPQDVRSSNGRLRVHFAFRSFVDIYGLTRYCYVDETAVQVPTLRVHPGDELALTLNNELKDTEARGVHAHAQSCGAAVMSPSATNLHFHGLAVPPVCHQDETLRTLIQPSDPGYEYRLTIPRDESPGLYWYHPHPHGFSEHQVLGGASGALIVEGIERRNPRLANLPERVLVLRDQAVPGVLETDEDAGPGKDISLNFVPVMYPLYQPGVMIVKPSVREFWRVLNAAADTYFDLQVRFGSTIQDVQIPQPIELVAVDGVVVGEEAAARLNHALIPPGGRIEFIVTTPPVGTYGQLVTLKYDAGPDGAAIPFRPIANIVSSGEARSMPKMPAPAVPRPAPAFRDLRSENPARMRHLYFSESRRDPKDANSPIDYFITAEGAAPKVFDMDFKQPDLTVEQGTVEDWTIENRAREAHTFHIHQLHFQLIARDGDKISEPISRDTIDIPYWDGISQQYPRVTLRMDFRRPEIVGTFVYHCHILEHEDGGMMGTIQVKPARKHPK